MMRWVEKLFPASCCLCHRPVFNQSICEDCRLLLKPLKACCRTCVRPLDNSHHAICGSCQKYPPHYDYSYAAFRYQTPVNKLITGLKFNGKLQHAKTLAEIFCQIHPQLHAQCLIPMPLHSRRTRERGFNQSLELARELSIITGITVDYHCCTRIRPTLPQASLTMKERRHNVSKAFQAKTVLPYDHVAIVDDVMTSGHSANTLAGVLKQSSVKQVDIWVMARAGS